MCFHAVISLAVLGKEDKHLSVRVQSVYRTTLLTHLTSSHRPSHTRTLVHNMTEKGKMMGVGRGWGVLMRGKNMGEVRLLIHQSAAHIPSNKH